MEKTLQIRESFVNLTKGHRYGDSPWYTPYTDNLGQLYRSLSKEYGRCVSKVYIDKKDGSTEAIGWVFVKRMEYEDNYHTMSKSERSYLQETWVSRRYIEVEE